MEASELRGILDLTYIVIPYDTMFSYDGIFKEWQNMGMILTQE